MARQKLGRRAHAGAQPVSPAIISAIGIGTPPSYGRAVSCAQTPAGVSASATARGRHGRPVFARRTRWRWLRLRGWLAGWPGAACALSRVARAGGCRLPSPAGRARARCGLKKRQGMALRMLRSAAAAAAALQLGLPVDSTCVLPT
jgi:hypothetical protein